MKLHVITACAVVGLCGCFVDLGVHVQKVQYTGPEAGSGGNAFLEGRTGEGIDTTVLFTTGVTWQSEYFVALPGVSRSGIETELDGLGKAGVGQNEVAVRADLLPPGRSDFGDGKRGIVLPVSVSFGTGELNVEDNAQGAADIHEDGSALSLYAGVGYGLTHTEKALYISGSLVGSFDRHKTDKIGELKAFGGGVHFAIVMGTLFGN